MEIVRESPEYHFVSLLDRLRDKSGKWACLHFSLSGSLVHDVLMRTPNAIKHTIKQSSEHSEHLVSDLYNKTKSIENGFLYLFSDCDVLLMIDASVREDKIILAQIYENMAEELRQDCSHVSMLAESFYAYQKLADQKMLSLRRFDAYEVMSDTNKIESIQARRTRRESPVILVVEDDRFTASMTLNLLTGTYDVVLARNGEEAIVAFADYAPDIVFMDIHLPGLTGHQTLQSIKTMDPESYVVMLSVDTSERAIQKASILGAQKFLKKPYSKERLISAIKTSPHIHRRLLATRDLATVR